MDTKEFKNYVEQALRDIPREFRDLLENITIDIDPDRTVYDKSNYLILGQYTGVPLPQRGSAYRNVPPDKIVIYKKALEKYPSKKLPELIRNVLMHEIGHYFGMSEEELARYKRV